MHFAMISVWRGPKKLSALLPSSRMPFLSRPSLSLMNSEALEGRRKKVDEKMRRSKLGLGLYRCA